MRAPHALPAETNAGMEETVEQLFQQRAAELTETAAVPTPTAVTSTVTQTPSPEPTGTPTPEPVRYDVPVLSQEGLTLNGASTGVGCVPVCIEMMTSYWNQLQGSPVLDAQTIIDVKGTEGSYRPGRGMSSAAAADMLQERGYHYRMGANSSKEELLERFEKHGPIGLLVKTRWVPDSMNHSVVMVEWDPNTEKITLNDPFYGSQVTWDWEAFDGIWGLNYAGDPDYEGQEIRRIYYEIFPESGE